jgi:hypothetical protein
MRWALADLCGLQGLSSSYLPHLDLVISCLLYVGVRGDRLVQLDPLAVLLCLRLHVQFPSACGIKQLTYCLRLLCMCAVYVCRDLCGKP